MSGIYNGPDGQMLHGDGKIVQELIEVVVQGTVSKTTKGTVEESLYKIEWYINLLLEAEDIFTVKQVVPSIREELDKIKLLTEELK